MTVESRIIDRIKSFLRKIVKIKSITIIKSVLHFLVYSFYTTPENVIFNLFYSAFVKVHGLSQFYNEMYTNFDDIIINPKNNIIYVVSNS